MLPIYEKANCFPAVPSVLEQLQSKNIRTAILSNGTPKMLEAGAKNAGIDGFLDHLFSVASVEVFKPDPKVYQLALDQLHLSKTELLFISSNQWDIAGAARFGLMTVWLNQHGQVREPFDPGATIIIKQLAELPHLLQSNASL